MEIAIIGLLFAALLLYIISLFQKSSIAIVEKQFETHSIQMMQEIYQLKKKIKALEEEYIIPLDEKQPVRLDRDDVLSMYEEGHSVEDIADMTSRDPDDIEEILSN
ncbi:hypothetical protein [Salisediminibacterium beveridgei]|uniref:Uncharacterized protein n=1 Tax=Salisediminibacterium beveridgei TaxID=632773 RepID=A0A1D7QUF0_9BACI|nr:hypothetical protein [Salisediminibacterium beveridgei]AOM82627.1 hypothetical protein BBEV_1262 [Salisediminibacterium beveridgei]